MKAGVLRTACVLLALSLLVPVCLSLSGCGAAEEISMDPPPLEGWGEPERIPNDCAESFALYRYENGDSAVVTGDGTAYLITSDPDRAKKAAASASEQDRAPTVLPRSPERVYLAATAVMSFFDALDALPAVRFSALESDGWTIENARARMEDGEMVYAGRYREPDYELLLSGRCDLSIQSTMSEHVPKVREKLEELGIPVFVDRSSYEADPLARCEWVRVYAELMGCPEAGDALFAEQKAFFDALEDVQPSGKTAVFFYVTASGSFVTRKSGDYVSKMIELAGGENVFAFSGDDNALSSVTVEPEEFCLRAKDADIIVYNGTTSGSVSSVEELVAKNELLADFRAVKSGNVWCTEDSLYQDIMKTGEILSDFSAVFSGNGDGGGLRYLRKLD
jgi:iron complex transport system substrate-binding protein